MSKAKIEKLRQRLVDTFMGAYGGYSIEPNCFRSRFGCGSGF